MSRWRWFAVLGVLAALLVSPPAAHGDGLPTPGLNVKPGGLATRDGRIHYLASAHHGVTTVRRVVWRTGATTTSRTFRGEYAVPAVAMDGSADGLSADGQSLALIHPQRTFPQARTHLAILDASLVRVRHRLDLDGDFSFDAISPDGQRIYLIHYLSGRDPTRYEVREYDAASGRLLQRPIVDPDEHGEQMRGYPMTRATSPDGRWDYTLYDGGGNAPFIHALDTVRGRAVCIDGLTALRGTNLSRDHLALTADAHQLWVLDRRAAPIAAIDTRTLKPARLPPLEPHPGPSTEGDAARSWSPGVVIVIALLAAGGLAIALYGVGGRLRPAVRRGSR
jgi:hypothetical protein